MSVVVVGAGVFGSWCAKFLSDSGHTVTLFDSYGPANGRASSSDFTRVIRCGYGADAIYSQWAMASLRDWHWLAEQTGQSLLARTGALFMGEPSNAYVQDTHRTLQALGIESHPLPAHELTVRFPQIATGGLGASVFEPGAGVIRARAAVQALVGLLVRSRGVIYLQAHVAPPDEQRADCRVITRDGSTVEADAYVFACGPWLSRLFPDAVGRRIRATRQEVLYFGVPAGEPRFAAAHLPVWIDFAAGYYGIPDLDALGFKVGVDRHGDEIDPDGLERIVDAETVARTREWLGKRFPGLSGAPLLDARVCQYENTSSGDFIIDRHPQWSNCWIVGGGSGHGFKHGPAVGRHLVSMMQGASQNDRRFTLATKLDAAERTVY